jgi:hypothetical protein
VGSNCVEDAGQRYIKWFYENNVVDKNNLPPNRGEFINKLLTDDEFYKNWGNDCCEEISRDERIKMYYDTYAPGMRMTDDHWMDAKLKTRDIPKRKLKEDEKI